MLLVGLDGSELELSVVGYRFPRSDRDPWDSNSLLVSLRVVAPEGTWEVLDPCLTTWETGHLIRWLAAAALGAPGFGPRPLTEPNLAFSAGARGDDRVRVGAHFELERRPPWARTAGGAGGLSVELVVERSQLTAAAESLAENLARFPQRGDDPTM